MDVGNLAEPCKSLCDSLSLCVVWFIVNRCVSWFCTNAHNKWYQRHNGIKAMWRSLGSCVPCFRASRLRSLEFRDRLAKLIFMIFESPGPFWDPFVPTDSLWEYLCSCRKRLKTRWLIGVWPKSGDSNFLLIQGHPKSDFGFVHGDEIYSVVQKSRTSMIPLEGMKRGQKTCLLQINLRMRGFYPLGCCWDLK